MTFDYAFGLRLECLLSYLYTAPIMRAVARQGWVCTFPCLPDIFLLFSVVPFPFIAPPISGVSFGSGFFFGITCRVSISRLTELKMPYLSIVMFTMAADLLYFARVPFALLQTLATAICWAFCAWIICELFMFPPSLSLYFSLSHSLSLSLSFPSPSLSFPLLLSPSLFLPFADVQWVQGAGRLELGWVWWPLTWVPAQPRRS